MKSPVDYSAISAAELFRLCFRTQDESAWAEFIRRFHPLIASVVLRVSRHWGESIPQVVEDLVQETYLKLCASGLRSFKCVNPASHDAIYGYIKTFTANLVQDHFKAARAAKRGGSTGTMSIDGDVLETHASHERRTEATLERKLLLEEIASCLDKAISGANADRDRRIFWLYYRVGLSASAIARLPSIDLNTKGVESTIARITRTLREHLGSGPAEKETHKGTVEGICPENSL